MSPAFDISHDWSEETFTAKARWFASLPQEQRFEIFCEYYELCLSINPHILEQLDHARPMSGRIQILERA